MLPTLALLLTCQLAGEVSMRGLGLPIPGPVAGLALMLAVCALRPRVLAAVRPTTGTILANLSLLFVPAGVGVVANLDLLAGHAVALAVVLVVSTLLAMLAAVGTFLAVRSLTEDRAP